jgi:DNA-binding NarL/FixJ family response regulator
LIRVLIADDQALVRAGFKMILDAEPDIEVVGEAVDGQEAVEQIGRLKPDVALMDIRMPRVNGIVATRRLRSRPNPPEVIVLTTFDTDENILHALRAGASGFLLKDTPPARIAEAVRQVAAGEPILSPRVTRRLMDRVAVQAGAYARAKATLKALSPRERDVVVAISQGSNNAEIAAALEMTLATVKSHVSHILTKLDLDNRTQIALLAHDAGLA